MTILHIIEPFASGVTTFIIHLTRELPQHEHVVFHGSRTSVDRIASVRARFPAHVKFETWKHAGREVRARDLGAFLSLYAFLKRRQFDVVHLHSSKAGFLGQLACRMLGIKRVIYSPHAASFLRTDLSLRSRRLYARLERLANRIGKAHIVCCSHEEQEDYRGEGMQCLCIPNGTQLTEVVKDVDPEIMLVICSALLKLQKNPSFFNAIAEAFASEPRVRFIWIGDGELRSALTAKNITITGWLESGAIGEYYARAPVYLATSAWEGMPYSVLEAMNARCALLLSDCGGHKELVHSGENGFLFTNVEEAVSRLKWFLGHQDRWAEMGARSKSICAQKFNATDMAAAYNELYRA